MKTNFFKVTKGNIECAFCKYSDDCSIRYYPNHVRLLDNGLKKHCKKDFDKKEKKILK